MRPYGAMRLDTFGHRDPILTDSDVPPFWSFPLGTNPQRFHGPDKQESRGDNSQNPVLPTQLTGLLVGSGQTPDCPALPRKIARCEGHWRLSHLLRIQPMHSSWHRLSQTPPSGTPGSPSCSDAMPSPRKLLRQRTAHRPRRFGSRWHQDGSLA